MIAPIRNIVQNIESSALPPLFDMATPAEIGPIAKVLGLSPAEVQYELAHLDETKEPSIMAAVGTVSALATISVLLRVWVRRRKKNRFMADDYAIFVALVSSAG